MVRVWPGCNLPTLVPAAASRRHFPTSIATLRTCKAEVVLGLSPDIVEAVQAVDKDWLVTGKYGVIQYRR